MAIPQIIKTRAEELNIKNITPTNVAERLATLGIKANANSSIKDILLAYLEHRGINVTNYRIRGIKLIDITDGDTYILPRLLVIFVGVFRIKKFPILEI